tara:strand:+ start:178 stop:309 length:132 start_codon:yes stop_codon:yes gene_type:complete
VFEEMERERFESTEIQEERFVAGWTYPFFGFPSLLLSVSLLPS